MRLHGFCTSCHKIKMLTVTGSAFARMAGRGSNIPEGICDGCQEREDARCRRR